MLKESKVCSETGVELLGECHPLLDQLGTADGLFTLSGVRAALSLPEVDSPAGLERFLDAYLTQLLLPCDLPAICRAHRHTSGHETRELIALDLEIGRQMIHRDFASASRRVGRSQLQRLRPLRDERIVRHYLEAVDAEQAQAWHTLVYGLTLSIYSLPVRQGLLSYSRQTISGFIQGAARPLRLSAAECRALLEQTCAALPGNLEVLLAEGWGSNGRGLNC